MQSTKNKFGGGVRILIRSVEGLSGILPKFFPALHLKKVAGSNKNSIDKCFKYRSNQSVISFASFYDFQ